MLRLTSFAGYFMLIGLAWLLSTDRKNFPWRTVFVGSVLQVVLALLILNTWPGAYFFEQASVLFKQLLAFSDAGAAFVFGETIDENPPRVHVLPLFAFRVLPTIIFVSALAAILYHLGIMQWVVHGFAIVMQKLMALSGAESLSASANIFLGQTEAPLLVRPYIAGMTLSELNAVMVGGFANISVSLLAVYADKGVDVGHLLTSSIISAPAGLLIAKIMLPETQIPATMGRVDIKPPKVGVNILEAAAIGATDGLKLALNVGAMLIVFVALVAMVNAIVQQIGLFLGQENWSLQLFFGYGFLPLAWLLGVPPQDCHAAGQLLGIKLVATEYMAYDQLGEWINDPESDVKLTPRTRMLMTYALCGFSNFASIGIQIAGLGAMAPDRQADLARLGLRAMIGGMLATCMTACIAGTLRPY